MEQCVLCDRGLGDGDYVYTDGFPSCCICVECATKHDITGFPCVPVMPGKIWTKQDITELLRPRVAKEIVNENHQDRADA